MTSNSGPEWFVLVLYQPVSMFVSVANMDILTLESTETGLTFGVSPAWPFNARQLTLRGERCVKTRLKLWLCSTWRPSENPLTPTFSRTV